MAKTPLTKKERGQSSKEKDQPSHDKKVKRDIQYYDVYVAKFRTERDGSDFHRALFVEKRKGRGSNGENPIGLAYHFINPDETNRHRPVYELQVRQNVTPENSTLFVRPMKKIGRVAINRIGMIFDVCHSVDPPSGPFQYTGSPDCNDWLNNVIYRLHQQGIVEFERDYTVPRREVSMVRT